jgi:cytochrome c
MARAHLFVVFFIVMTGLAITQSSMGIQRNSNQPLPTLSLIAGKSQQVFRGAELYEWHCSVCHGPTGLGRLDMQGNDDERDVFSIGDAPDIYTLGTLEKFVNAGVLSSYIQSAMPRYEPGRLTTQEALDITAFLLALHGQTLEALTEENAKQIAFAH